MSGEISESSFTNTFLLADLSSIPYRKYIYSSNLHFKAELIDIFELDLFLQVFTTLLDLGVACSWKPKGEDDGEEMEVQVDENTFSRELWVFEYQNVSVFNNAEVDQLLVKLNVSYQSGTIPDDDSSLLLQDRFTESMRNLLTRSLTKKGAIPFRSALLISDKVFSFNHVENLMHCNGGTFLDFSFNLYISSSKLYICGIFKASDIAILTSNDFTKESSSSDLDVFLAPYGLKATLVNITPSFDSNDQLLSSWSRFLGLSLDSNLGIPNCVKVFIKPPSSLENDDEKDGILLDYPSSLVFKRSIISNSTSYEFAQNFGKWEAKGSILADQARDDNIDYWMYKSPSKSFYCKTLANIGAAADFLSTDPVSSKRFNYASQVNSPEVVSTGSPSFLKVDELELTSLPPSKSLLSAKLNLAFMKTINPAPSMVESPKKNPDSRKEMTSDMEEVELAHNAKSKVVSSDLDGMELGDIGDDDFNFFDGEEDIGKDSVSPDATSTTTSTPAPVLSSPSSLFSIIPYNCGQWYYWNHDTNSVELPTTTSHAYRMMIPSTWAPIIFKFTSFPPHDLNHYSMIKPTLGHLDDKYGGKNGKWRYKPAARPPLSLVAKRRRLLYGDIPIKKKVARKRSVVYSTDDDGEGDDGVGLLLNRLIKKPRRKSSTVASDKEKSSSPLIYTFHSALFMFNLPALTGGISHSDKDDRSNIISLMTKHKDEIVGNIQKLDIHDVDEDGELFDEAEEPEVESVKLPDGHSILDFVEPKGWSSNQKVYQVALDSFTDQVAFSSCFLSIGDRREETQGLDDDLFDVYIQDRSTKTSIREDLNLMLLYGFGMTFKELAKENHPLTVQQYLDSQDSENTLTYGKVQLRKKKKSAEQTLVPLSVPDMVFHHSNSAIQAPSSIMRFWEKVGLEPFGGKKSVNWFTLFPDSSLDLRDDVIKWFVDVGIFFDVMKLGTHIPGFSRDFAGGLVPVPLKNAENEFSNDIAGMRGYSETLLKLGLVLSDLMLLRKPLSDFIVIYIVNVFPHLKTSVFDLSYLFSKMLFAVYDTVMKTSADINFEEIQSKIVLQIIPVEGITDKNFFHGHSSQGMKQLCLNVYNQCRVYCKSKTTVFENTVEGTSPPYTDAFRSPNSRVSPGSVVESPVPFPATPAATSSPSPPFSGNFAFSNTNTPPPKRILTSFYTPAFILTSPSLLTPHFSLSKTVSNKTVLVMEPDRVLHVAYKISRDKRWVSVCWCDSVGELYEVDCIEIADWSDKDILNCIWTRTLKIAGLGGFCWRIVLAKFGSIDSDEINDWIRVFATFTQLCDSLPLTPSILLESNPLEKYTEYITSVSITTVEGNSFLKFFDFKSVFASLNNNQNTNNISAPTTPSSLTNNYYAEENVSSPMLSSSSLPGSSEKLYDFFVEDLPKSFSLVLLNHLLPLRDVKDPSKRTRALVSGWIADVSTKRKYKNINGDFPSLCETTNTQVSLVYHYQNPRTETFSTVYSSWTSKIPNNMTSTTPAPHHVSIIKDILKQYHESRFLNRGPILLAVEHINDSISTEDGWGLPFIIKNVDRMDRALRWIPKRH